MPICPSCGAACAGDACASCGRPLAAPAIGEVVEDSTTGAAPGSSPWGAGRVHHARELPTVSRGWLTAGRVLLAPTLWVVLAAVVGAATQDSDASPLFQTDWSTEGFQTWLALVLTGFGAPVRFVLSSGAAGLDQQVVTSEAHLVMYLVTLGWLALLWCGLHLAARARRRAGAAEPTLRAAGAQALRTGALSGAAALLLGLLGHHDVDLGAEGKSPIHFEIGTSLLPLAVSAVLAAAALAGAVDGAAALRAEAAGRRWAGGLLLAWQHAFRVVGALLALLTVVALVVQLVSEEAFPDGDPMGLVTNSGLLVYGIGSGATSVGGKALHRSSMSLFDLGDHSAAWWLAVVPVLAAALALGWSAHRGRLTQLDRARLAGLYAVLTGALVLGTSMWVDAHTTVKGGVDRSTDQLGWSLPSVLIASAAWAVFGALVVPAVLDAVRRTPVPLAPPRPDAGLRAELPEQAAGEPHGLIELVVDEPAPVAVKAEGGDPHAAYRRPGQD
ncbi:hypothetical protein [Streptomyces sp. TLI_171]|uniref:hypothetical protein n=1 Tax=Streptomyces sp. TLI_171 TaxID=1938859 RepID=UPI000C195659|nr:hypothetical protein [Streptomyces sp. TLI_171]RKE19498.1 hypothetical protein BX266_2821 [Streptomyces sp. TLI_171]